MKLNKKHLFIEFYVSDKVYECNLSTDLTLMENLIILISLIKHEIEETYQIDKYLLVYEKVTNTQLNIFIPLKNLNLTDGLTLVVY